MPMTSYDPRGNPIDAYDLQGQTENFKDFLSCLSSVCCLPSGELTQQWKITIFNGKIHYKWPCSIAVLVHQRVSILFLFCLRTWSNKKKRIIEDRKKSLALAVVFKKSPQPMDQLRDVLNILLFIGFQPSFWWIYEDANGWCVAWHASRALGQTYIDWLLPTLHYWWSIPHFGGSILFDVTVVICWTSKASRSSRLLAIPNSKVIQPEVLDSFGQHRSSCCSNIQSRDYSYIPSGKLTVHYGKIHHF